jgi:transposase
MSMANERQAQVSYVPKILRNMAEICEEMGVGEKTVKAWVKRGAPIAVEGEGRNTRYSAESAWLQRWRYSN